MTAEQFQDMVNAHSGLLGLSEISPDMRDLLEQEGRDVRAAEAVALFCYQGKKWIGAYAAALGGLTTPVQRRNRRTCSGRAGSYVRGPGVSWHPAGSGPQRGRRCGYFHPGEPSDGAVMRTDEEIQIAQSVCRLLASDSHQ